MSLHLHYFTFNDFYENTYVWYDDETLQCAIIDPGCSKQSEREQLDLFIKNNNLKPVLLINTHCHIDHILGNRHIANKYGLSLSAHEGEAIVLESGVMVAQMYGIPYDKSPRITTFYQEGDKVTIGHQDVEVIFTPGHSPASISFYHAPSKTLVSGDVLFAGSIGRTDLPGGDFATLIESISNKLLILPEETRVYSGHGNPTTIGIEKRTNPFL